MTCLFTTFPEKINWEQLRQDLIDDDFHNGRTTEQLRASFLASQQQIYVLDGDRCIGTARALSDGICNAYIIDVWTQSRYRHQGIGLEMMKRLLNACPGQHINLFTDDACEFYMKAGFTERPVGMETVSGKWLQA